jgi:hypothetical protein
MADMTASEQQWLAALTLMVAALFVSSGLPVAPQWRKRLRIAAIGMFILALVAVLVAIAREMTGGAG